MTNNAHIARYGRQLEVNRIVPGSAYTMEGCETLCRPCHAKKPKRPAGSKRDELAAWYGRAQFNAEIDSDIVDLFRAFCRKREESVRDHLEIALRRHLDNPPPPLKPPTAPPLPPLTSPPRKKPKG